MTNTEDTPPEYNVYMIESIRLYEKINDALRGENAFVGFSATGKALVAVAMYCKMRPEDFATALNCLLKDYRRLLKEHPIDDSSEKRHV